MLLKTNYTIFYAKPIKIQKIYSLKSILGVLVIQGTKKLKEKVQARTNGKGSSHGIMRCIYAKAQIALKRPYKRTLQVL